MSDFNNSGRMRFDTPFAAIEYHASMAAQEGEDEGFHVRHIRQYMEALE